MSEMIYELRDDLVDNIGKVAASLGINRVAGQLYIVLFLSAKPMSLDEMTKALKVSKGHVSTNIRALERWKAVRKLWVKGSRKDFYEANTDTLNIIATQLSLGLNHRFEELDLIINRAKEKIGQMKNTQSKEQIQNLEDKIKKVEKMYSRVSGLLGKLDLLKLLK